MPVLGGLVSYFVNRRICNGLMCAAEKYYSSPILVMAQDIESAPEAKVASEIHSCTAAIRRQIVGLEANAKSIKQEYARRMHGLQESHQALVLNQMILQRETE